MGVKIGLDLGSTAIKAVIVDDDEAVWRGAMPTAPEQARRARSLIDRGFGELGLDASTPFGLASTGYGKNLYPGADLTLDELSANARGLFKLSGGEARAAVNIGGQDLKVMRLSEAGRVADFRMNDKCAAGTGRFFELAARLLDAPLEDFYRISLEPGPETELSSTCVVFAETEIVSLLAGGATRGSIVRALHASVSRRAAGLLGPVEGSVWLDGGPAMNRGLVEALADELLTEVRVVAEPQYTVAYGAALSLV
ncbi:MAG: acyl-CoA dehydratase activase [Deltaproteobacteria bacterium]|jgi:predicted CoA-substrate-specific enzyme activase|nr:acyl-CoA dehydratase activase [Deltaproteobacteria bacterium]